MRPDHRLQRDHPKLILIVNFFPLRKMLEEREEREGRAKPGIEPDGALVLIEINSDYSECAAAPVKLRFDVKLEGHAAAATTIQTKKYHRKS